MTQEIITITVEAGQMTARRKSRKIDQRRPVPVWAIVKYAALCAGLPGLFRRRRRGFRPLPPDFLLLPFPDGPGPYHGY